MPSLLSSRKAVSADLKCIMKYAVRQAYIELMEVRNLFVSLSIEAQGLAPLHP
jgi:hypothetical protein